MPAVEPPVVPFRLAFAQAALRDTVVMVATPTPSWQRWIEVLASVATIVIALALILLAVALLVAAWNSRRIVRSVNALLSRLESGAQPVLRHANDVADNVNYITTSIRGDVEQFRHTLDGAQARLGRASELAEQRIREFDALLKVVQEEAEHLFIDTASTMRGVRASVETLQQIRERERRADRLDDFDEEDLARFRDEPRRQP
jgi:uncharacterized protein YoxC